MIRLKKDAQYYYFHVHCDLNRIESVFNKSVKLIHKVRNECSERFREKPSLTRSIPKRRCGACYETHRVSSYEKWTRGTIQADKDWSTWSSWSGRMMWNVCRGQTRLESSLLTDEERRTTSGYEYRADINLLQKCQALLESV